MLMAILIAVSSCEFEANLASCCISNPSCTQKNEIKEGGFVGKAGYDTRPFTCTRRLIVHQCLSCTCVDV